MNLSEVIEAKGGFIASDLSQNFNVVVTHEKCTCIYCREIEEYRSFRELEDFFETSIMRTLGIKR